MNAKHPWRNSAAPASVADKHPGPPACTAPQVIDGIISDCLPKHEYKVDIGTMDKVRERIEKWYQDKGLPFCYVGYFDGMEVRGGLGCMACSACCFCFDVLPT